MPRALQHECPRWEVMDDGSDRQLWRGRMRIVHGQRARKLRKRGVPLLPLHAVLDRSGGEHRRGQFEPLLPGPLGGKHSARYAWFEPEEAVESRERKRALHCYLTATRPAWAQGRKAWLCNRLESHRAYAQERAVWRRLAKALTGRYAMPETATGAALDALCGIPARPAGMTDAELRVTIVAPENEGGYTYDMSRASLRYECPGCVACPHDGVHPGEGVA